MFIFHIMLFELCSFSKVAYYSFERAKYQNFNTWNVQKYFPFLVLSLYLFLLVLFSTLRKIMEDNDDDWDDYTDGILFVINTNKSTTTK